MILQKFKACQSEYLQHVALACLLMDNENNNNNEEDTFVREGWSTKGNGIVAAADDSLLQYTWRGCHGKITFAAKHIVSGKSGNLYDIHHALSMFGLLLDGIKRNGCTLLLFLLLLQAAATRAAPWRGKSNNSTSRRCCR